MPDTPTSPYCDPSVGDLIIRTSDGIEFHVHRRRIADFSSVFADMLSLPEPPTISDAHGGTKAVVDVTESGEVWEKLLPMCYVAEEPSLPLKDIRNLLEAARKYDIPGIKSRSAAALLHPRILDETPFAVYMLACVCGSADVARIAAKRTLCLPIYPEDSPEEYACIDGRASYRPFQ